MFRSAHFEVIEIIDQNRKRHDEWRKEKEHLEKALTLKDISQLYKPSEPLSYDDILNLSSDKLLQKTIKYKKREISIREISIDDLDALVYVNLKDNFFDTSSSMPSFERLCNQGWRSVSMIMPYYSYIFYCKESAPEFLKKYVGKPKSEWTDYGSNLFEV